MLHYFQKKFLQNHIIEPSNEWNSWMSKTIPHYLTIQLEDEWKNQDFEGLLKFIGGHCNIEDRLVIHTEKCWEGNEAKLYSNAYKAIQYEIRYYCPRWLCSNEIRALRFSKKHFCRNFIRIPYKAHYLFATIYDIVTAIRNAGIPVPHELQHCCNQIYRVFYDVIGFYQIVRGRDNGWEREASAHASLNYGLEAKLTNEPFNLLFQ